jgi:aminoglycoside phosphotransferase (APT) family kinase protein
MINVTSAEFRTYISPDSYENYLQIYCIFIAITSQNRSADGYTFMIMANSKLELAAKTSITKYVGKPEALTPLYVQPDRAIFLAASSQIVLKVYADKTALQKEIKVAREAQAVGVPTPEIIGFDIDELAVITMKQVIGTPLSTANKNAIQEAGNYLRKFHRIGAKPPFSGGQSKWDEFILWWSFKEIDALYDLSVCDEKERDELKDRFSRLKLILEARPIVLLHGDLQTDHILVDPKVDKVLAFIDFADAQPGDPLLDIAVLTLWNHDLTPLLLEGYGSMEDSKQTQAMISHYRLLRHIAEIPWLYQRGYKELANQNILRVKEAMDRF